MGKGNKSTQQDQEKNIIADATRLHDFWQLRDEQMQSDRDRINLVKPIRKDTDAKLWLTSEPKVFFDTSRSLVSLYQPRFRLPIPINYSSEQKDKMNKAERLCIGIYRTLDAKDSGSSSWLYDLAYWVLQGWYAVFTVVQKGDSGVEFIADQWDPINVYPEWSRDGLVKCARIYQVDKVTSESMAEEFQSQNLEFDYKVPKSGDSYSVTNYWRRDGKKVFNAILLNNGIVKPLTHQTQLDHIPVRVGVIGIPEKVTPQWQLRTGESIIASARDNYDFLTAMRSLRAEIIEQTAWPNIVTKTKTGQPAVKGQDIRGHKSVIPLRLEDTIDTLKHAASPQDVNILEQQIGVELSKANLPNVVYGGVPVELSGFAISQLMAAIKYKLGPYLNAMKFIVGHTMTALLYQYRKGKFGTITLSTRNPYDMKRGMYYIEEFTRDDIPERIYVEVEIPISSQFDKTQTILNSIQALQGGLLSRETLWENELDIQDSEQEKQRITEDRLANDPFIQQLEIIMRMRERVSAYKATGLLNEAGALENYILTLEANLGIVKNIGTPPSPRGINPEQRPAEMTPKSPDMMNAMIGKPPPSPNRLSASKKKGTLYRPNGEVLL